MNLTRGPLGIVKSYRHDFCPFYFEWYYPIKTPQQKIRRDALPAIQPGAPCGGASDDDLTVPLPRGGEGLRMAISTSSTAPNDAARSSQ